MPAAPNWPGKSFCTAPSIRPNSASLRTFSPNAGSSFAPISTAAQASTRRAWRGFFERLNFRWHVPTVMQPRRRVGADRDGFLWGSTAAARIGRAAFSSAGVAAVPVASRVRYVEPEAAGKVQIIVEETQQKTLSGSLDDDDIQRLLLTAAKDPTDPGLRGESVGLADAPSGIDRGSRCAALQSAARFQRRCPVEGVGRA